jgi:hypothetical protein
MPTARCFHACAVVLVASLAGVTAAADAVDLAGTFQTPTSQFRPWLYGLWMNGNVTREGLTADLEAMARVGFGGALIFNVSTRVPAGTVAFASPEWHELFKHACAEANRLGLEINVNNDAGWCGSGGP